MDKRGTNGESLFHMCFLNNTRHHDLLAKRILEFYPNVINDIYLNDEMYGQTALHMCIANGNLKMLLYLIKHGANIHMRCCGSFFGPCDQYTKRVHDVNSEFPSVPVKTDYVGSTYFGEYPLSFAAVLREESHVRVLLRNEVNPDLQDSNGNTVIHMMVLENDLVLIETIFSSYFHHTGFLN